MRQLYRLLERFREAALASTLAALSIILIINSDSPQIKVLRGVAVTAYASVQAPMHWFSAMFRAREENTALRTINMTLMEEVMKLRRMRRENDELRQFLGFAVHSSYPLVPAEVIGKSYVPGQWTITLNVGISDSVRPGMPVIHENGLVGLVIAAASNHCLVQPAMSRNFRVSAKVLRSRVDGIIAKDDGQGLLLQNGLKTADIQAGDSIITSSFSNTFPSEIPIGIVVSIGPGDRGLFSRIDIRPHVDFSRLERVFVMRWQRNTEQEQLERRIGAATP